MSIDRFTNFYYTGIILGLCMLAAFGLFYLLRLFILRLISFL